MKVNVACSAEGCKFEQSGDIHDYMIRMALDGHKVPLGSVQEYALGLKNHQEQAGHAEYFAKINRPGRTLRYRINFDSNGDFILNPPIDS